MDTEGRTEKRTQRNCEIVEQDAFYESWLNYLAKLSTNYHNGNFVALLAKFLLHYHLC